MRPAVLVVRQSIVIPRNYTSRRRRCCLDLGRHFSFSERSKHLHRVLLFDRPRNRSPSPLAPSIGHRAEVVRRRFRRGELASGTHRQYRTGPCRSLLRVILRACCFGAVGHAHVIQHNGSYLWLCTRELPTGITSAQMPPSRGLFPICQNLSSIFFPTSSV